jgi:hypothetical protein
MDGQYVMFFAVSLAEVTYGAEADFAFLVEISCDADILGSETVD